MRTTVLLYLSLLLVLPCFSKLMAQEQVYGLQVQPLLFKHQQESNRQTEVETRLLELPFFEDFSTYKIYPDPEKWMDRHVFVNQDFPLYPPNTGAATFDALDEYGYVYEHASINGFIADYLTSWPIRLDSMFIDQARKLDPSDSLYLSFFFQPQGRGNSPESDDSLVLQFGYPSGQWIFDHMDSISFPAALILIQTGAEQINMNDTIWAPEGCDTNLFMISDRVYTWDDDITMPCDSIFVEEIIWRTVWAHQGMSIDEFNESGNENSYFKQVLIPITDTVFFSKQFQFRFFNYASISYPNSPGDQGNADQWNVDFIYLNADRNVSDKYYDKLCFSGRAPTFLKRYESMPYRQYRVSPIAATKPELNLLILNLSNETLNTKYMYKIDQIDGSQPFIYDGGNCNLHPFFSDGFQSCTSGCGKKHACPDVKSLFALNVEQDTVSFMTYHYISDSAGSNILVDSLVYRQGFYNYYAYDDGTAEMGYNLEPTYSYLAYQFTLATPDTLKAIHIFFNKTLGMTNDMRFDLIVWNDRNQHPDEIVYRKEDQRPQFSENLLGFATYKLDQPVILNGNFYIGLMKKDPGNLNIGLDRVNNSRAYLFYKIGELWEPSQIDGALMMRPAFGSGEFIGITETKQTHFISHHPNPANTHIQLELHDSRIQPEIIQLIDLTGRINLETRWNETIDISDLKTGLYIIRIYDRNKNTVYQSKVLITP